MYGNHTENKLQALSTHEIIIVLSEIVKSIDEKGGCMALFPS